MTAGRKNNSTKKDWNTPPKYIKPIKDFFGGEIDLDPCSNEYSLVNAKDNILFPSRNGLIEKWNGNTIFVNPPYGRNGESSIFDWFNKAIQEYNENKEIIFLVPVATNTKYFKELVFKHFDMICFLSDTRLKFYSNGVEDKKGAPMACCLIYKGINKNKFKYHFEQYGKVFQII